MPNPRLLINLLKGFRKAKGMRALGKKTPKKIPYQKWTETLNPVLKEKVRFDGIQEKAFRSPSGGIGTKPGYYQFTDKKSGSTFLVPLEEDMNFGVWEKLRETEKSFGGKKAEIIPFVSKGLKTARERFQKDINRSATEKQAKVQAYQDWLWQEGDRVLSPETKNVYEITGRSWHTKRDEPFYLYKSLTKDIEEKGGLFAREAEKDLILLSGPKGLGGKP